MPDELLDIARGNPRLALELERMLKALARNASPVMREMAHGVLNGGSLREAAASSAYGDEVSTAFTTFWVSYQSMSDSERAELEESGKQSIAAPIEADELTDVKQHELLARSPATRSSAGHTQ